MSQYYFVSVGQAEGHPHGAMLLKSDSPLDFMTFIVPVEGAEVLEMEEGRFYNPSELAELGYETRKGEALDELVRSAPPGLITEHKTEGE
jgi:hypothetical protein